jgi:hypothetical protein
MESWNDRPDDDGATEASERVLQQQVDGVVTSALAALGRAFSAEDPMAQLRAELLLEVVRAFRRDLRSGAWRGLSQGDLRQLRDALRVLDGISRSGAPVAVA